MLLLNMYLISLSIWYQRNLIPVRRVYCDHIGNNKWDHLITRSKKKIKCWNHLALGFLLTMSYKIYIMYMCICLDLYSIWWSWFSYCFLHLFQDTYTYKVFYFVDMFIYSNMYYSINLCICYICIHIWNIQGELISV